MPHAAVGGGSEATTVVVGAFVGVGVGVGVGVTFGTTEVTNVLPGGTQVAMHEQALDMRLDRTLMSSPHGSAAYWGIALSATTPFVKVAHKALAASSRPGLCVARMALRQLSAAQSAEATPAAASSSAASSPPWSFILETLAALEVLRDGDDDDDEDVGFRGEPYGILHFLGRDYTTTTHEHSHATHPTVPIPSSI